MNTETQATQAPAINQTLSFDLPLYLQGGFGLITRSGLTVEHLSTDNLCAVVENANGDQFMHNYEINGFANKDATPSDLDLMMYKLENDHE